LASHEAVLKDALASGALKSRFQGSESEARAWRGPSIVDGAKRAAVEAAAPAAVRDKHAEVYPSSGRSAGKDDVYFQHQQQQPSSQSLAPYRVAAADVDVRFNMLGDLTCSVLVESFSTHSCLWSIYQDN
jgi:hypothetical protein